MDTKAIEMIYESKCEKYKDKLTDKLRALLYEEAVREAAAMAVYHG